MKVLFSYFTAIAVTVVLASVASAQLTVAEWGFNKQSNPVSADTCNSGFCGDVTGVFIGLGGGFGPPVGKTIGSPGDTTPQPDIGGVLNNNAVGRSGPLDDGTEASGTRIMGATASTAGYEGITVSWHATQGFRASRFYQLSATSNGTDYFPVSGGTGSSATVLGSNGLTSSVAEVDDNGLFTFITDDGVILPSDNGDGFVYELSYTFPVGSVYDNNPDFGFQLAAVYDDAAGDYVSSFAGTTGLADPVAGYIRSTSAGGNSILYDAIKISAAVPEPTSLLLAACGLAMAGVRRRR